MAAKPSRLGSIDSIAERDIRLRIRVYYPRGLQQEPIISQLISEHGLRVNKMGAARDAQSRHRGFDLELTGAIAQIQSGLIYLESLNLQLKGKPNPDGDSRATNNSGIVNNKRNKQRKMGQILEEVLTANQAYTATFGEKANLTIPPARRFTILTCMDARLDPAKFAGLAEGDAHVIRNAGGRASDDAIRSLVISYKLLGTREWFVIHHTHCGMETFTDQIMRGLLANSLETATLSETGWQDIGNSPGSAEAEFVDWLTIEDLTKSVVTDVKRIRFHPLVSHSIPIYGFIYDVKTGKLVEVPEATEVGKALL